MQHTYITLERLQAANPVFFDAAGFHGDKGYKINNEERTLIVRTARGNIIYSVDKNLRLTYLTQNYALSGSNTRRMGPTRRNE